MSEPTDLIGPFVEPYIVSSIGFVMLMYVFRIVQVKFQPNSKQHQNKLTMLPLVIVFTYLLILLTLNLLNYFDGGGLANLTEARREVYNIVSSMFWSMILFAACFEWEAITFLVKFQSSCPLD